MKHPDFTTLPPGFPGHRFEHRCYPTAFWCRIHRYPSWATGSLEHEWYPVEIPVPDGEYTKADGTPGIKWKVITVHCGPSAFYPRRPPRN